MKEPIYEWIVRRKDGDGIEHRTTIAGAQSAFHAAQIVAERMTAYERNHQFAVGLRVTTIDEQLEA